MTPPLQLHPIGVVRSPLRTRDEAPKQGDEGAPEAWIVARVDRQHRAVAAVEPGEHQDLAAGPQLPGRFRDRRIEQGALRQARSGASA